MPARHTAQYKNTAERTTENVVSLFTNHFHGALAVTYHDTIRAVVSAFSCQQPTAEKMLRQAMADGAFYVLKFHQGALGEYTAPDGTVTEINSLPHFVTGARNYGLIHDDSSSKYNLRVADGATALALPLVFEPWLEQHRLEQEADNAARKARYDQEQQEARGAHPGLAAVEDFAQAWQDRADRDGRRSPVQVKLMQIGAQNQAYVSVTLIGKRADKASEALLAVLQEYFPLPNDQQQ